MIYLDFFFFFCICFSIFFHFIFCLVRLSCFINVLLQRLSAAAGLLKGWACSLLRCEIFILLYLTDNPLSFATDKRPDIFHSTLPLSVAYNTNDAQLFGPNFTKISLKFLKLLAGAITSMRSAPRYSRTISYRTCCEVDQ